MKITVYGCGYVGLVTAALLADTGNNVLAIDTDSQKIKQLQQAQIPIYEPGLVNIVARNLAAKRLQFSDDTAAGATFGQLQFIAVGTPADNDGSADLQFVLQVAEQIGQAFTQEIVVIDKSTVPVGTAAKVRNIIKQHQQQRQIPARIAVIANPEFLKEGDAIADFMRPDRIIIGADNGDEWAVELMRELYDPFNRNHDRLIVMDVHSAELTKYAANAMLATKLSFMNEMALVAESVGADIEMVRKGIGADPRIGYHFIYAGCGYGGSCFPKDVRALTHTAQAVGIDLQLVPAVTRINDQQQRLLFKKVQQYFGETLHQRQIAVWGLAFKPNTDDLREAPSLTLLHALWAAGVKTTVYDPKAMPTMRALYPNQPLLNFCESAMEACTEADALVIATDWREFKSPDFHRIKQQLKQPLIIDGRNLYSPKRMQQYGFIYLGIGRGTPAIKPQSALTT